MPEELECMKVLQRGENVLEPGLPETFNVLIKELQSLALNVELVESDILTEAPSFTEEPSENQLQQ